jgi:hypothetical protein
MSQGMYTLVCLGLAAVAYFVAGMVPAGSSHDGLIAVAGALITLQMRPRGEPSRKSLPPIALVFLVGCGASVYDSTLSAINGTAQIVNESQNAIAALCYVDPGQRCDDARKAYEVAGAAVAAAHDALAVYRVTGEGLDEVGRALKVAADSAREVGNVLAD